MKKYKSVADFFNNASKAEKDEVINEAHRRANKMLNLLTRKARKCAKRKKRKSS